MKNQNYLKQLQQEDKSIES